MYAFTGREKGYSEALGAPTRGIAANTLEALGLVERQGTTRFKYRITGPGTHALSQSSGGQPPRARTLNVMAADYSDVELEVAAGEGRLQFPEEVPTAESNATRRQRRGQNALRKEVLRSYGNQCAVCDIAEPELLVASHIARWTDRVDSRGNLANVICLCTFHDALFERGYWVIDNQLQPRVLHQLGGAVGRALLPNGGLRFRAPSGPAPDIAYLQEHRKRHSAA
jgi:hypothetical protein